MHRRPIRLLGQAAASGQRRSPTRVQPHAVDGHNAAVGQQQARAMYPGHLGQPDPDHRLQISGQQLVQCTTDGADRWLRVRLPAQMRTQAQDDPLSRRAQPQALRTGMDHGQQKQQHLLRTVLPRTAELRLQVVENPADRADRLVCMERGHAGGREKNLNRCQEVVYAPSGMYDLKFTALGMREPYMVVSSKQPWPRVMRSVQ